MGSSTDQSVTASSTAAAIARITALSVHVTHVTRAAMTPYKALTVKGNGSVVLHTEIESVRGDIEKRLARGKSNARTCADITLAAIIRAFRAQLPFSAPEFTLRKWRLYCGFEGRLNGTVRRVIPLLFIDLPQSITAATPLMTPAHTIDGCSEAVKDDDEERDDSSVDLDSDACKRTLTSLLEPLVSAELLCTLEWSATCSVVIGEDEEEERRRRADALTASVALTSAPKAEGPAAEGGDWRLEYNPAAFSPMPPTAFGGFGSTGFGSPGGFGGAVSSGFGTNVPAGGFGMPGTTTTSLFGAVPAGGFGMSGTTTTSLFGAPSNGNSILARTKAAVAVPAQRAKAIPSGNLIF